MGEEVFDLHSQLRPVKALSSNGESAQFLANLAKHLKWELNESGEILISVGGAGPKPTQRSGDDPKPPARQSVKLHVRDRRRARDAFRRAQELLCLAAKTPLPDHLREVRDRGFPGDWGDFVALPRRRAPMAMSAMPRPRSVGYPAYESVFPMNRTEAVFLPTITRRIRDDIPLLGRDYPEWYFGFNDLSKIELVYESDMDCDGWISFEGTSAGRVDLPVRFKKTDWEQKTISIAKPILFADRVANLNFDNDEDFAILFSLMNHIFVSRDEGKLPDEERTPLLTGEISPLWENCRYPEAFQDIRIRVETGAFIRVEAVTITLNNMWILNTPGESWLNFPRPFPVTSLTPLYLTPYIRRYRLKMAGMDSIPDVDDIISFAARHIGEIWSPLRPGRWDSQEIGGGLRVFEANPRNYCSEFAAWAIDCVTGLQNDNGQRLVDGHGLNIGTKYMQEFFENFTPARYVSPVNTAYGEIGARISRGFYVAVNEHGHSTFFAGWVDPGSLNQDDPKKWQKVMFSSARNHNTFRALGGNQTKGRVSVDAFTVARDFDAISRPTIVWQDYDYPDPDMEKTEIDGFGNTKLKLKAAID